MTITLIRARRQAPLAVSACALAAMLCSATASWAQTPTEEGGAARRGGTTPTPIRFDNGINLTLRSTLQLGRNNNVVGTSTNVISSSLAALSPTIVAELKTKGDEYLATYNGTYTQYDNSKDDNFNNHELSLVGTNVLDSRNRVVWGASYIDRIDPRGTTDRAVSPAPDRHTGPQARLQYTYGAEGAQGRIQGEFNHYAKRYQNNRAITQFADIDTTGLAGRFFYRLGPATQAVLEGRLNRSNFIEPTSTRDSLDTRLLAGAEWSATAATSGSFRVGVQRKNFSNNARPDTTRFTYEGGVVWKPLSYSEVRFNFSRSAEDATAGGDFLRIASNGIAWQHGWTSTVLSQIGYNQSRIDFANGGRNDVSDNLNAGLFYVLGTKMRFGVEVIQNKRDSSLNNFDFTREIYQITLGGAL